MGRSRLRDLFLDRRWRTVLFLTMLATVVVSDLGSAAEDCHTLRPLHDRHQRSEEELPLSLEDKLALSPIVVQARLISRFLLSANCNAYNNFGLMQLLSPIFILSSIAA